MTDFGWQLPIAGSSALDHLECRESFTLESLWRLSAFLNSWNSGKMYLKEISRYYFTF